MRIEVRTALAATLVMLTALPACAQKVLGRVELSNPSFETGAPLDGWELTVYGAQPTVAADEVVRHEGQRALRITAAEPSDTAFAQELTLTPGRWYRLSAWVKTQGLDPGSGSVCGTIQVQNSGGRGVLASGASHRGDQDWVQVRASFRAPDDGRVRVCGFFVGFGKGVGTAWFDDFQLEEVDMSSVTVRVTRDAVCPGEISPMHMGQFIEYLCDLVPGMWAERLYDGSFEGLSPYNFVYLKETDFREKPWYPCGATNRAEFTLDRENPVSGDVCKKISVPDGAPCTVGISQDGVFVEKGRGLTFRCYMRQSGVGSPVRVALHRDGKTYAAAELKPGGEWKKLEAHLTPTARDTGATLSITFKGPGALWLDNASLMPDDNVAGWRPDVVRALRALKPAIVRFGGSVVESAAYGDFDWRQTIGDPDHRRPFRSWGGLQPTGPGMEEIVHLIRMVDAEPLICVSTVKQDARGAADEVEYFNGSVETPMGALRARNGHPEPYRIKYWQVGNEQAGAEYEKRLPLFARAMKAVDPSIKILASYPTEGVLEGAGDLIDYVCPHHYGCDNLAYVEGDIANIRRMIAECAPGRDIKIGVTEWNTTAGDAGPRRAMLWTLANALACARYHHVMHRNADIIEIANRSNLTNSFCSGIIQTDNHRLYKTPTYYAQELYATLAGTKPLRLDADVEGDTGVDLSATLSRDGRTLTIFAVNDTREDLTRTLDLSAFARIGQDAAVWTLEDREHAGEPDVTNSFGDPERIAIRRSQVRVHSGKLVYRFPALSLTAVRFAVKTR